MTGFFLAARKGQCAAGAAPLQAAGPVVLAQPCPLTVPLLCSLCWRRLQPKGARQVQGRGAQTHLVQRRPQIDHVSLLATPRVEASEDVVLEGDAQAPPPTP